MAELGGKQLDIAPSTVFKRIEKLKTSGGVIEGFTISINPDYFAESLISFLTITVSPDDKEDVASFLANHDCVLELYETLEPSDFMVKVVVSSITNLKNDILIPLSRYAGGVKEIKPFITVKRIKEQNWSVRRYD
ncbi:Lrp/AsnC family transcriptional regulator [Methanogenium cariaci]|uniref:Lrp/AsnC family transcriptional regulator n=1 Tax=Methanogenium cariaci TaxID=2197 RepID=UPI001FE061BD|nr:Lrp/AsnC family transcriptional regulator [Methanogenium cariaci]